MSTDNLLTPGGNAAAGTLSPRGALNTSAGHLIGGGVTADGGVTAGAHVTAGGSGGHVVYGGSSGGHYVTSGPSFSRVAFNDHDAMQPDAPHVPNTNPNHKEVMAQSIDHAVNTVAGHMNTHSEQALAHLRNNLQGQVNHAAKDGHYAKINQAYGHKHAEHSNLVSEHNALKSKYNEAVDHLKHYQQWQQNAQWQIAHNKSQEGPLNALQIEIRNLQAAEAGHITRINAGTLRNGEISRKRADLQPLYDAVHPRVDMLKA